jgi:hypothetical protein
MCNLDAYDPYVVQLFLGYQYTRHDKITSSLDIRYGRFGIWRAKWNMRLVFRRARKVSTIVALASLTQLLGDNKFEGIMIGNLKSELEHCSPKDVRMVLEMIYKADWDGLTGIEGLRKVVWGKALERGAGLETMMRENAAFQDDLGELETAARKRGMNVEKL